MYYISDFKEGDYVKGIFLCKNKVDAKTKNGRTYYSLTLQDKTGTVDGKIWDLSSGIDHFEKMDYIAIDAEVTIYQGAKQLNIRRVRRAHETEYDVADYVQKSPYDESEMFAKILSYVNSVKSPCLHELLVEFFVNDEAFAKAFREHSAAKSVHHSFMNGLLQHTLRVTELCDFYCKNYPMLNRDLLISGALLHDIGKIDEIDSFPANDYTDEGQLIGHIAMGYAMVSKKIDGIEGFPKKLANEIEHLILSHHGELEFGSPKKPAIIEAVALHHADNTDAKLQSMSELLESAEPGENWLGFQRMWDSNVRRTSKTTK